MSTRKAIFLIGVVELALGILWLVMKSSRNFTGFELIAAFVNGCLLCYAFTREKTTADKSENASRRDVIVVLAVVGIWVAYLAGKELMK